MVRKCVQTCLSTERTQLWDWHVRNVVGAVGGALRKCRQARQLILSKQI